MTDRSRRQKTRRRQQKKHNGQTKNKSRHNNQTTNKSRYKTQTTNKFHGLGIQNEGSITARDITFYGDSVEQHGDAEKKKQRTQFLRQLRTDSPFEERKNRNPPRADGTCQWFMAHERFQHWQQQHSALLWVSADPGCGKSVLARYLIDDVFPPTDTRTTCYFFFKDDFEDQKSLEGALRCILYQIFKQNPHLLLNTFLEEFEEEGDQLFATFRKLWDLLNTAAINHTHGEIICILDALDECQGCSPLAIALTQLYSKVKRAAPLKFLVTSRPYLRIRQDFQTLKASQPTIHLSGESQEESDKIAREIGIMIEQRTENLCEKLELHASEKQVLQAELATVKHRNYLWVHLVFADLEERTDIRFSKDHLRQAIRNLPHTVEEAYDKILRKSKDPDKARMILQLVVAADRPLRLTEMATLLALQPSHRSLEDLEKELSPPDVLQPAIREACGLFLTIEDSQISLFHQTAREFLVESSSSAARDPSLEWQYSLQLRESHRMIAETCMRYLALSDFCKSDSESMRHWKIGDEDHFTFRDYAACNWAGHYRRAQDTISPDTECLAGQLCNARSGLTISWLRVYGERQMQDTGFYQELTTRLLIASYFGLDSVVKLALQSDKNNLKEKGPRRQRTALSWASEKGYDLIVQSLLNEVPKFMVILRDWSQLPNMVNLADCFGRTPLWYAAANGHNAIVQHLLKGGARVGTRDEHGMTPLSWAAHHGHDDIVALLLGSGARHDSEAGNLETTNHRGQTPLMKAARDGELLVAKLLLDRGAQVNSADTEGRTALTYACIRGRRDLVGELLGRGALVNLPSDDGDTALIKASRIGYPDIVQLLLDNGARPDASDRNGRGPLIWASIQGNVDTMKAMLDNGQQVDAVDGIGKTALMWASETGHESAAKILLDRGAFVDAVDGIGKTALIWASEKDHGDVVKLLLDRGAFVDAVDGIGKTALIWASEKDHRDVVKLLLDRGAFIDAIDRFDSTALFEASAEDHKEVVQLLPAWVNADEGRAALLGASENGHKEVVQLLLEHGARVDCSWAGKTALELASSNGHKDIEKLLLAYGARRR